MFLQVYRGQPPTNRDDLVARIRMVWERLPQDMIRRAIDAMPGRFRLCEDAGGDQIVRFD